MLRIGVPDCSAFSAQFGRPVGAFQAVSHELADMKVDLEAARLLTYKAASKLDRSRSDETLRAFYGELLELRRTLPKEVDVEVESRRLRLRRGPVVLEVDLDARTAELRR